MFARILIVCLGVTGTSGPKGPETTTALPVPSRYEFAETHMGSSFKVVLYSTDEATARDASREAYRRIAELDAILSDYQPESELSRLSAAAGGAPVKVSDVLFDILDRSTRLWERSEGAFDVTMAPVGRLWRRARRTRRLPDQNLLEQSRRLVGSEHLELDRDRKTVRLVKAGMKLDAGGIAKGYASQAALDVLKTRGIRQALVAGAGDVVVGDPPPGMAGWRVDLKPLLSADLAPVASLTLKNAAISTSGDAERFVEIDGKRYSHIVDPRTGLGVIDRAGVTVIAKDGATADSMATAVYVLGPERGLKLIESTPGTAAYFVRMAPASGEIQRFVSTRFKPYLEQD
jgi:thiamine biosynthesis lipoprotein